MTLSQIIAQALRQLDEDAEDVSEYEERFRVYANMGYDIAVREYLKPEADFLHRGGRGRKRARAGTDGRAGHRAAGQKRV